MPEGQPFLLGLQHIASPAEIRHRLLFSDDCVRTGSRCCCLFDEPCIKIRDGARKLFRGEVL